MIDNNKTINCEICGTEINGEPFKTKIENSTMITCKECSKYGVVQKKPQSKKPLRNNNNFRNNSKTKQNNNNNYKRKSDVPEYEIIEDYGTVIKQAREKQKITREKLSEKLYEKESVIARIENNRMVPDIKLAHKFEKVLKIKIIEKLNSEIDEQKHVNKFRQVTIGDIAHIKKNK